MDAIKHCCLKTTYNKSLCLKLFFQSCIRCSSTTGTKRKQWDVSDTGGWGWSVAKVPRGTAGIAEDCVNKGGS